MRFKLGSADNSNPRAKTYTLLIKDLYGSILLSATYRGARENIVVQPR